MPWTVCSGPVPEPPPSSSGGALVSEASTDFFALKPFSLNSASPPDPQSLDEVHRTRPAPFDFFSSPVTVVGQKLISCENLKLAVSAHTDDSGVPQYNQKLSQRRASVVRQHLLSMGVQSSRIESNSYGEMRPVAPNSTTDGRQLNRRVQMELQ